MSDLDVIGAMPKTEVHLHLEGTISPETLWDLARRNRVALPVPGLDELRRLYAFEDFGKFVELWTLMCSCLKSEEDYVGMVDGFLAYCGRQNIRYAEAHFTPYNHEKFGIGAARSLDVVTRRLAESEASGGPSVRLVLDIPSEHGATGADFTASFLESLATPLVVAIGLGGPEKGYPRSDFSPYFERARRAGYASLAHAGETGGPEHVRQAVVDLKARRVQHGVAAVEDESVLRLLAEREVCCDVALTSNACLTPYVDLATHPVRRMIDAGVPVTISTDDPPFFGTDLGAEYRRALRQAGLSMAELWEADLNGLRFGLAETGLRRRLMLEFEEAGRVLSLG